MKDPFQVEPKAPSCFCPPPTKCNPCGGSCQPICGIKNPPLTCRPRGRQWGRACGPCCFQNGKWIEPTKKIQRCSPIKIWARRRKVLPYGFGLYARKIYPHGLPCIGTFCFPKPCCNTCFYPLLPTKPSKVYSPYTFNVRGAPYTCPRPCVKC